MPQIGRNWCKYLGAVKSNDTFMVHSREEYGGFQFNALLLWSTSFLHVPLMSPLPPRLSPDNDEGIYI